MKKMLSLLLVSALLLTVFAGCKREEPEPVVSSSAPVEPTYTYHDGDYSVSYQVPAIDRTLDYLIVSIEQDKITVKEYGMREDSSDEQDADTTEAELDGQKIADLILTEYEDVRGQIDKMQPVKDQEEHTYRFMRMMRTALKAAEAGDDTPVTLDRYADGDYTATMPDFNADGWKEYIELSVADGLIKAITFDAIGKDDPDARITTDEALNAGEQKPAEYYPQIAQAFLDAGENLSLLIAPAGGAAATKSFKKLVPALLATMTADGERTVQASRFVNGTYRAEFTDFDANGWKDYVVIKILNDQIAIKEFDATFKDDETKLKSQDSAMSARQEEKTGMTPTKAIEALRENWKQAEHDVTRVDNVAGATVSANNFKLLVGQILATAALEGDTESTLQVERIESETVK